MRGRARWESSATPDANFDRTPVTRTLAGSAGESGDSDNTRDRHHWYLIPLGTPHYVEASVGNDGVREPQSSALSSSLTEPHHSHPYSSSERVSSSHALQLGEHSLCPLFSRSANSAAAFAVASSISM